MYVFCAPPALPASPSHSGQLKRKGNEAYQAQKWLEAVDYYSQAIDIDATNAVLFANRSAAYLQHGEAQRALEDAKKAVELNPQYVKAYGRQGAAHQALKDYDGAVAAYQKGLEVAPDDAHLKQGLQGAQTSKLQSSAAHQAAHKTRATRRASKQTNQKASLAPDVSQFVQQTKLELQLQMAALQSQLDFLNELASLTDHEKLALLFVLMDQDRSGTIDARELAAALRRRRADLSFNDSLDRAMQLVAIFDADGDQRLDLHEFQNLVYTMLEELGTTFHEFAEFLVLQILYSDSGNTDAEDLAGKLAQAEIDQGVQDRQRFMELLVDPRMLELFMLFDKDESGALSFKEVAIGLYQLSQDMEGSAKAAIELLLALDEDGSRTLDYEQFARLILSIVTATGHTFDEVADMLTLAMTVNDSMSEREYEELLIADELFGAAANLEDEIDEEVEVADALSYGRLRKLFDLVDADHSGLINFEELRTGLQGLQVALGKDPDSLDTAVAFMGFDEDGDNKLNPEEFTRALIAYSKILSVDLHELIDYMCVANILQADGATDYSLVFGHSLAGNRQESAFFLPPVDEEFFM